MIKIAIDAIGGDNGLETTIPGAIKALELNPEVELVLVGNSDNICKKLEEKNIGYDMVNRIDFLHANDEDNIPMDEKKPLIVSKNYPNSSMLLAIENVKKGKSDAVVSSGNTGALVSSSFRNFRRIKGLKSIALASNFPDRNGSKETLVLDLGADKKPSANKILQNTIMAALYLKNTKGIEKPKVGLINIGEEENKGREIDIEAYELLKKCNLINFIGNIEPDKVLDNDCDILVTDGFTGNIVLKTTEGIAKIILEMLKDTFKSSIRGKIGGLLIKEKLKDKFESFSSDSKGGAILLGVNFPTVKAHGGSSPEAFASAIEIAYKYAEKDVINEIKEELKKLKQEKN